MGLLSLPVITESKRDPSSIPTCLEKDLTGGLTNVIVLERSMVPDELGDGGREASAGTVQNIANEESADEAPSRQRI